MKKSKLSVSPKLSVKNPGFNVGVTKPLGGENSVSVKAGVGPQGVSVSPKIQIGDSEKAQIGGSVGSTVGTIVGTPFGPAGSAVGSAVGSAIGSSTGEAFDKNPVGAAIGTALGGMGVGSTVGSKIFKSGGNKEHKKRNSVRGGVFGDNATMLLPDGSQANFSLDAAEGLHNWKYSNKRVDKTGDRQLYAYETDYTNDLDYLSSMGGISLSRLLTGNKNKEVDQLGQLIGNQALGKNGYGADFNVNTFNSVANNLRSIYSQKGIKSKEEMLSLANKAYSEGRINDADLAVSAQTANMIFDNDYNLATQLMSGRWDGLNTAFKTSGNAQPQQNTANKQNGKMYTPLLSAEEAQASVRPLVDKYKQAYKEGYDFRKDKKLAGIGSFANGLGIASGAYNLANTITGGVVGNITKDFFNTVKDSLFGVDKELTDYELPKELQVLPENIPSDYQLGESTILDSTDTFSWD